VSDILAEAAVKDIIEYLPKVLEDRRNLEYRERMQNASLIAGMAFTNVSLGITHSMSHALGGLYGLPHGLLNAILLPYVIEFNSRNAAAKNKYEKLSKSLNSTQNLINVVRELNVIANNPSFLNVLIADEKSYIKNMEMMIDCALADGCTKTNPIIPTREELRELYLQVYYGKR